MLWSPNPKTYLADETGWGGGGGGLRSSQQRSWQETGHRMYINPNPKMRATKLSCSPCVVMEVLKSLIILENSFPLVGEGEGENIPDDIFLSKTLNGLMEKQLYADWLTQCVVPHKMA